MSLLVRMWLVITVDAAAVALGLRATVGGYLGSYLIMGVVFAWVVLCTLAEEYV